MCSSREEKKAYWICLRMVDAAAVVPSRRGGELNARKDISKPEAPVLFTQDGKRSTIQTQFKESLEARING